MPTIVMYDEHGYKIGGCVNKESLATLKKKYGGNYETVEDGKYMGLRMEVGLTFKGFNYIIETRPNWLLVEV